MLACSGEKDNNALVWKIADGTVHFQCQGKSHKRLNPHSIPHFTFPIPCITCAGHKDSVTCTGFSHDSKYVATADMGGLIQVWASTNGELVWSFETGGDIEVQTTTPSTN